MQPIRIAIVIPTRNRSELAIRSVESVLASSHRTQVSIILSDNSTDPEESAVLNSYVSQHRLELTMIRPPNPLPMTKHWNFALDQALDDTQCTHFAFLTDRMLFKKDALRQLLAILAEHSRKVVSYTYERIDDLRVPIIYKPLPRSGKLIRIQSRRLLDLSAHMVFPSCLPRMLNSVCPRDQLVRLKVRFGQVFDSISPDFNFCYRILDAEDSIIFYDQSLLLNYAQGRSNGASFARGVMTRDSLDFLQNMDGASTLPFAPLPYIVGSNGAINEYCGVKLASTSGKFADISYPKYLEILASQASCLADKRVARETLQGLRQAGWKRSLASRISAVKEFGQQTILRASWRKYPSIERAIAFATSHTPVAWPWLPHPALRYGEKLATPEALLRADE